MNLYKIFFFTFAWFYGMSNLDELFNAKVSLLLLIFLQAII